MGERRFVMKQNPQPTKQDLTRFLTKDFFEIYSSLELNCKASNSD